MRGLRPPQRFANQPRRATPLGRGGNIPKHCSIAPNRRRSLWPRWSPARRWIVSFPFWLVGDGRRISRLSPSAIELAGSSPPLRPRGLLPPVPGPVATRFGHGHFFPLVPDRQERSGLSTRRREFIPISLARDATAARPSRTFPRVLARSLPTASTPVSIGKPSTMIKPGKILDLFNISFQYFRSSFGILNASSKNYILCLNLRI